MCGVRCGSSLAWLLTANGKWCGKDVAAGEVAGGSWDGVGHVVEPRALKLNTRQHFGQFISFWPCSERTTRQILNCNIVTASLHLLLLLLLPLPLKVAVTVKTSAGSALCAVYKRICGDVLQNGALLKSAACASPPLPLLERAVRVCIRKHRQKCVCPTIVIDMTCTHASVIDNDKQKIE